ncbi:unnamed protein product [Symbiodinium sp. CCMP2592]|nr:unnamed protein product [Symbiodinium sp. CCMP2592]
MAYSRVLLAIIGGFLRSAAADMASTCNVSIACIDDSNVAECERMYTACGDQMMMMESCPLQFGCPPCPCGEACTFGDNATGGLCDVDSITCVPPAPGNSAPNCSATTTTEQGPLGLSGAMPQAASGVLAALASWSLL